MIAVPATSQQAMDEVNLQLQKPSTIRFGKTLSASMHIYLWQFDEVMGNADNILAQVRRNKNVLLAQFNHTFVPRSIPNDSLFANMWDMQNTGQLGGTPNADINATAAWNITTGGLTAEGDTIVVAAGGEDSSQRTITNGTMASADNSAGASGAAAACAANIRHWWCCATSPAA